MSSGDDVQTEEHALQTTATWISNIFSSDPSFDFETVELELRLGLIFIDLKLKYIYISLNF